MDRLDHDGAVVTPAGGGIDRATAVACAWEDASVAVDGIERGV